MTLTSPSLHDQAKAASAASRKLASTSTEVKNAALHAIADAIEENRQSILRANEQDLEAAKRDGLDFHMMDRMTLTNARVKDMADAARNIAALEDPIGEILEKREMPNGLDITRVRVPLGVIGVIYESRPNVTIDIATLCLKSGNGVVLRGGKECILTNTVMAGIVKNAIESAGIPRDVVQFVESTDRALVKEMLEMDDAIDLMIPRGSAELVNFVGQNAKMPAITGGVGVCHTYVDADANLDDALNIVVNAKAKRPTVCNAMDTLLVHQGVAREFLPKLATEFGVHDVELRADGRAMSVLGALSDGAKVTPAQSDDFGMEFLALIAAVKIVDSMDDAMEHIAEFGSKHSEAIISENKEAIERFLNEVDSGAVFANTSTYFNDGAQFGLGAEVAISTNKLHARGPMGLKEITTYKWKVRGQGQVRS
ncbi:glutamate-5-semialdehyde dehydrogenase [Candidatus Lucifugimonas marina]|jgi:glutamate-5-semialdehyde dehydrogenase|uniref:Gamma-glutamyl phosphate reductase n=1 Tax=Candidatus Lucifugimonas marina TaxID=3038979 RepID=A0AAJ6CU56_9CHLR|nr:glutamate-5-semialdehyde dehydrogenase [SAR202 cluster bacterium JH702]MDG0869685.1 glutamate-5-semialdehyde dehydrogenase [SAR202 cluster bacterium JH639]WFG34416.1 glutamate-5-semialdehyde dehydrogenase [SAR202 cluster bacterium JH545]WFG38345.1 glutamate-5-semialdehyde dehydrogenase [SAR202 cluster bacterium JH1073]